MSSRVVAEKAWICWDAFSGRASWASCRHRVGLRGSRGAASGRRPALLHTDLHEAPLPGLQHGARLLLAPADVMRLVVAPEVLVQLAGAHQQEGALQGLGPGEGQGPVSAGWMPGGGGGGASRGLWTEVPGIGV